MYRFRSIEKLLDKKELEDQYIYFSDVPSLNDPMEGFRQIHWRGDIIPWRNLFNHYVFCLEYTLALSKILPTEKELSGNHIPVLGSKSDLPTAEQQYMHDEIRAEFLSPLIEEYLSLLAARSEKIIIGRDELFTHLRLIHLYALHCILVVYNQHDLLAVAPPNDALAEQIQSLKEMVEMLNHLKTGTSDLNQNSAAIFSLGRGINSQLHIRQAHNAFVKKENPRWAFITQGFTSEYMMQIEKLLFPEVYIACFMEECTNPTVWAHYADSHKGVALKFRQHNTEDGPAVSLMGVISSGDGPTTIESKCVLRKINYNNTFSNDNFFTTIGRLGSKRLLSEWYTNASGQISPLADEVLSESHHTKWKAEYWKKQHDAFYTKLEEWAYEREWRITLSNIGGTLSDAEHRKLKYRFNELEGIIFGTRTSMDDKLRIIEIVSGKCLAEKHENFRFYQSQFNSATGKMEIVPLNLLKPL